MSFQQKLKDKLVLDQFPEVFQELLPACPAPEQKNTVIQNQARYNEVQMQWNNGLISRDDYTRTINTIRFALLQLIDQLTEDVKEEGPAFLPLHPHHQHTCDRVDQSDLFHQLFDRNKEKKVHYFYIYGPELQSHLGLFNRFSYDLEGRLQDYLNPDLPTNCTARRVQVTFDVSRNIHLYKENLVKSLFAAFSIAVNEQEPLLEKNLGRLLSASPQLSGMTAADYVCIFMSISEWDWDPEMTPDVVHWLIESFCEVELPPSAPSFLFFFGIMYEEDDSEVEEQVRQAIEQSNYIKELPELEMVGLRDINQWLAKYRMIAPGGRIRRDLVKQHFEENEELDPENRQKGEFYMEDVEIELQKMIDFYNRNR